MEERMPEYLRDIGAHGKAIEMLETEVRAMRRELVAIRELLSETKGGVRMLVAVGSIGGAVGAAFVKFWAMLRGL
jgi:hypothetical protein